jgi:hypothetical protein
MTPYYQATIARSLLVQAVPGLSLDPSTNSYSARAAVKKKATAKRRKFQDVILFSNIICT